MRALVYWNFLREVRLFLLTKSATPPNFLPATPALYIEDEFRREVAANRGETSRCEMV